MKKQTLEKEVKVPLIIPDTVESYLYRFYIAWAAGSCAYQSLEQPFTQTPYLVGFGLAMGVLVGGTYGCFTNLQQGVKTGIAIGMGNMVGNTFAQVLEKYL